MPCWRAPRRASSSIARVSSPAARPRRNWRRSTKRSGIPGTGPCASRASSSTSLPMTADASRPLDGLRVIDLTEVLAGPYCSYQLALLGAQVIKVERPRIGDGVRDGAGKPEADGLSAGFLAQNADKRSIVIDLKHARGPEIVMALVRGADVFIENFSPGTAARLRLGAERLMTEQPKLVYASISGYGQERPMAAPPAHDHVGQAGSGGTSAYRPPGTGAPALRPPPSRYIAV